jgi:ribonuclease T2
MPGVADGLDRYEWRRHGVCTGLTAEAYFSAVVRLAEQADATIGAVLRDGGMLGHEVKVDDLLAAVAAKDASLAAAMIVSCRFPREGGSGPSRAYIQEIRLVLSKDFVPEPAEHVGFGQNSGCPGKAGFLPGGFAAR